MKLRRFCGPESLEGTIDGTPIVVLVWRTSDVVYVTAYWPRGKHHPIYGIEGKVLIGGGERGEAWPHDSDLQAVADDAARRALEVVQ